MLPPLLFALFGLVVTIMWLVIGWRAMKAHEKIAKSVAQHLGTLNAIDPKITEQGNAQHHKLYRQFILEHPELENTSQIARHALFRQWMMEQGHEDTLT
jgi:hypothetical protein